MSARGGHDLVALDCNAVAPGTLESELFGHERGAFTGADAAAVGVFELAHGTTLFLDEIGNLPLERAGEAAARPPGAGVPSPRRDAPDPIGLPAGHRDQRRPGRRGDAATASAKTSSIGLRVVHLHVPPLRERREDVPLLVSARDHPQAPGPRRVVCRVTHAALDQLCAYDWPGNVRELENVIETAMLECDGESIDTQHLRFAGGSRTPELPPTNLDVTFREARQHAMQAFERLYLIRQLRRFRGRITDVAHHAGVTTKHVRELMRRHGIDRRDFRPPVRPARRPASSTSPSGC